MATDALFLQSEVVRPKLQRWLETFKVASNLIQKGEVQRVGERDYRIPVELAPGGRYGTYNKNLGDMGRGTSISGNYLVSSFFSTRINFELSMLKMAATESSEVAIKSAFKDALAKAMPEFAVYDDMSFHTDGTAAAAVATAQTPTGGITRYTLNTNFGIQRLRRGMYVTIYDAAYAAIKASTGYINKIDYQNKTVDMSILVPGVSTTDVLCFDGVTTVGSAPTWKKGLYYFNSYAASGYLLGIDRSTEPETIANYVNVAGVVNPLDGLKLLDYIGQRRGLLPEDLVGLANTSQRAQIYTQQYANTEFLRDPNGGTAQPTDSLPNARKGEFPFAGIKFLLDYRQDRSRLDIISPKTWGRARLAPTTFFEVGGQRFWAPIGTSGAPSAGLWFSITNDEDFYCVDPGSNGVLYGCTVPTGY